MSHQEEFIDKYKADFINSCKGTHLFPSVVAAQACLETGYGKHIFNNNMFGVKGYGKPNQYWKGAVSIGSTIEYVNDEKKDYKLAFRCYDTVLDSIMDHNRLINKSPIYELARQATTPEAQCNALQSSGYATAPTYAKILIWIINTYHLKKLDNGNA